MAAQYQVIPIFSVPIKPVGKNPWKSPPLTTMKDLGQCQQRATHNKECTGPGFRFSLRFAPPLEA